MTDADFAALYFPPRDVARILRFAQRAHITIYLAVNFAWSHAASHRGSLRGLWAEYRNTIQKGASR